MKLTLLLILFSSFFASAQTFTDIENLKNRSNSATVSFHSQTTKKSLVAQKMDEKAQSDSLFTFIGNAIADSSCSLAGVYNRFGEINFFSDSILGNKTGTVHFLLQGKCKGLYLETNGKIERYHLTPEGELYLNRLYNMHKQTIK